VKVFPTTAPLLVALPPDEPPLLLLLFELEFEFEFELLPELSFDEETALLLFPPELAALEPSTPPNTAPRMTITAMIAPMMIHNFFRLFPPFPTGGAAPLPYFSLFPP